MKTQRKHIMGEGGYCVCPKCETRIAHRKGVPCQDEPCPACGAKMLREGSEHHTMFVESRKRKEEEGT